MKRAVSWLLFPSALVIRHDTPEILPVITSMITMPQMYQFVDNDVVNQAHRGLDDSPVQADGAPSVAAAPPLLLVRDDDTGHGNSDL